MSLPPDLDRLLDDILGGVEDLGRPLVRASRDPMIFHRFLHQIGWDLDAVLLAPPDELVAVISELRTALVDAVRLLVADEDPGSFLTPMPMDEAGTVLASRLIAVTEAVRGLASAVDVALGNFLELDGTASDPAQRLLLTQELCRDLGEHLLMRYLASRLPWVLTLGRLVGMVILVDVPGLYPQLVPQDGDQPLRLPMRRLRIATGTAAQAVRLPAGAVLRHLTGAGLQSLDTAIIEVEAGLAELLRLLRDQLGWVRTVLVSVSTAGVTVTVPGVVPDLGEALTVQLTPSSNDSGVVAPFPALTLDGDQALLQWSAPAGDIELVAGRAWLLAAFVGASVPSPGIELEIDLTSAAPVFRLSVNGAVRLVTVEDRATVDIGIGVTVELDAADEFSFAADAEVAGELYLPLGAPGLSEMALRIENPALRAIIGDANPGVEVLITVDADALTIDLPRALFRRADRADDELTWTLSNDEPAQLRFALLSERAAPLASLTFGPGPAGYGVTALTLLPPAADTLRLSIGAGDGPRQGVFLGGDDLDHGFVIEFDPIDWDFGSGGGALDGGVAIDRATVWLPPAWETIESVIITDARIDEHGFTGSVEIAFADDEPEPAPLFGVLPMELHSLRLSFEQNIPVAFELKAAIELPWFDEWVDIEIGMDDAFDVQFTIASSDPEGITLTKKELLTLTFRSAGFTYTSAESLLRVHASGALKPLLWNTDGLEWPQIDIADLAIEQNTASLLTGTPEPPVIRFEEAWLDLKNLATLDLFGFHFELNRIGVGYVETTDMLWIDLTGSLRLIELIPVGLGVDGFRITWPRRIYEQLEFDGPLELDDLIALASRIEVQFDGIHLAFGVPKAVEFEGTIRFIKDAQKIGFAGDVALRIPSAGLAIEAGLMVGMNFAPTPYPFLYVYFGILLPTGIPLGPSGLALKGAKGLFGLNVEPDRDPGENPYYDWYKRGPTEGAHPTEKWRDQIWSIAFGAGITITTVDGKLLGVQGLLVLVFPGPIIMIEGKALVFDGVFPGDGPLKALGYFDGNEQTAQFNIEASMELVEGLIDVNAGLEAYFDFNDFTKWHLYLGVDQPLERRVHANILKLPVVGWLFEANSYLMLDQPGPETTRARLGVYVGFEPPPIDLVVATAEVRAVIDGDGLMTLNPFQFSGNLELAAVIDIEAFGLVPVGIAAAASVSVTGALPLVVDAMISARVDLPLPDFDAIPVIGDVVTGALDWFEENIVELPEIPEYLEIEIGFHWQYDGPPVVEPMVRDITVGSRILPDEHSVLGSDLETAPVVPLDARLSVVFDQQMNPQDELEFGGFASDIDRRFASGDVWFLPTLRNVEIWQLPLHQVLPGVEIGAQPWVLVASGTGDDPNSRLWGSFRPDGDGGMSRRVLDLWTPNPFDFLTGTVPLALPSEDGGADRPDIDLALTLAGRVSWCDSRGPDWSCIGGEDIVRAALLGPAEALGFADTNGPRMRLMIRDVSFTARRVWLTGPDDRTGRPAVLTARGGPRDRTATLTVHLPEPVTAVRLTVPAGAVPTFGVGARRRLQVDPAGPAEARPAAGGPATFQPLPDRCAAPVSAVRTVDDRSVTITSDDWFECVHLTGADLEFVEVCWITATAARAAALRIRDCERSGGLAERSGERPVVLQSGSYYRMRVNTAVELDDRGNGDFLGASTLAVLGAGGALAPFEQPGGRAEITEGIWRTAGPPSDLAPYVKWVSPSSGSAGHLYRDDLVIRFNRPYLRRLYPDVDNSLLPGQTDTDPPHAIEGVLRDTEGRTLRGFFHNWTTAGSATLEPPEQVLRELLSGSPAELPIAPGDDVLELRHKLIVRAAELGRADWTMTLLGQPSGDVPKWRRQASGEITVSSVANVNGSAFVTHPGAREGIEVRVEVVVRPSNPAQGVLGLVMNLRTDPESVSAVNKATEYLALRWHCEEKGAPLRLVRVRQAKELVLAEMLSTRSTGGAGQPGLVQGPTTMELSVRRVGAQALVQGALGSLTVSAVVSAVDVAGGLVGIFARSADATFSGFAISRAEHELLASTRYRLQVFGGEGGRMLIRDNFAAGVGTDWVAQSEDWITAGRGLKATRESSRLAYAGSVADIEVLTDVDLTVGAALRIAIRTPPKQRPVRTRYEVVVARTSSGCEVTVSIRPSASEAAILLAQDDRSVGDSTRMPVRVRVVGDRLQVWVFEWKLADVALGDEGIQVPATVGRRPVGSPAVGPRSQREVAVPIAWDGGLEWQAVSGTPTIRSIELRDPALLTVAFTTSKYASFADHINRLTVGEEFSGSGPPATHLGAIDGLVGSQRAVADARLERSVISDRHRTGRADRTELDVAEQALAARSAVHDDAVHVVLSAFGAAYLAAPGDPVAHGLVADEGSTVAYLVRTDESLDPKLYASAQTAAFESTGRTEFMLTDIDTGIAVPTGWITTTDGTIALVYRRAISGPISRATPNDQLAAVPPGGGSLMLSATFVRNHGDDTASGDHRLDRPYLLARSASEPETSIGLLLS